MKRSSLPPPVPELAAITVCDGCWRRGTCERVDTCRCPCDGGANWRHTDDPWRKQ